jgi:uncharacterized protein YdeI (YjbR/CyaY-like superfamily)
MLRSDEHADRDSSMSLPRHARLKAHDDDRDRCDDPARPHRRHAGRRRAPLRDIPAGVPERVFFSTPAELRAWLAAHHLHADELNVGFYKTGSGWPSITWPESVREALCFGWIDGVRRRIDEHSYEIRFTPRRPGSTWSAINIALAQELLQSGEMQPAGRAAFETRRPDRSRIYSYERTTPAKLPPEYQVRLNADAPAAAFFAAQPPSYRRAAVHWVVSAKREETRGRRLDTLIADSRDGVHLKHLRRSS